MIGSKKISRNSSKNQSTKDSSDPCTHASITAKIYNKERRIIQIPSSTPLTSSRRESWPDKSLLKATARKFWSKIDPNLQSQGPRRWSTSQPPLIFIKIQPNIINRQRWDPCRTTQRFDHILHSRGRRETAGVRGCQGAHSNRYWIT